MSKLSVQIWLILITILKNKPEFKLNHRLRKIDKNSNFFDICSWTRTCLNYIFRGIDYVLSSEYSLTFFVMTLSLMMSYFGKVF